MLVALFTKLTEIWFPENRPELTPAIAAALARESDPHLIFATSLSARGLLRIQPYLNNAITPLILKDGRLVYCDCYINNDYRVGISQQTCINASMGFYTHCMPTTTLGEILRTIHEPQGPAARLRCVK